MKKLAPTFIPVLLVLTISMFCYSCQKEVPKRPFKLESKTWYRIAPATPAPITVDGNEWVSFAYFPGSGSGNATHMGSITHFFNQLAYGTSPAGPPAGSVAAPVVDVPQYPVLGGPLPLIQGGDFDELATLAATLQIPASVGGHVVNEVITNRKGDALFLAAIGGGATFPLSETIIGFNGKALIVGGSGRFTHATGEVDYDGYFNVTNASDAAYNAAGWISY